MSRAKEHRDDVVDEPRPEALHRCVCCNGVIAGLSGQDASIGLDTGLGLVSEECAFICNGCTARLMEMSAARRDGAGRSR